MAAIDVIGEPMVTNSGKPRRRGRSGGVVDAPGKKHRSPMPTLHGAKHSDERIAKLRTANEVRQRRKGGGR